MRGGVAGGGSAVFAVQAASLKGEDKFIAEPDVHRSTSATARKRRGAETSSDLLACFAVFDGHVNASASSHAERRMLPALLECGANEPEALLETSCVSAFVSVERSFKRGGTCGACCSRSGGAPRGGTTACVVLLHLCRGPAGPHLDVVAANAGDSGALLVQKRRDEQRSPTPSDDDAPRPSPACRAITTPTTLSRRFASRTPARAWGACARAAKRSVPCEATPAASPCRAPSAISDPPPSSASRR